MAGKLPEPLDLKRFYILLALVDEPLYGLAIHRRVLELSRSALYFYNGSLYRILTDLARHKYIEELETRDTKRRYKLTPTGYRLLRAEAITLRDVTAAALRRLP